MFRKSTFFLLFLLIVTGCGNTQFTTHFEKGRMIDFTRGKWLLNLPFTNYKSEYVEKMAAKHFKKILGDSLTRMSQMPNGRVVAAHLPFEPSPEQLELAGKTTGHDFLINVEANMGKNEMGSFAHAPAMGSTINTNNAGSKIRIYDLNTGELISQSSTSGVAEVLKSEGDKNWDYVNSAQTITLKSIKKLIRQYRQNGITN